MDRIDIHVDVPPVMISDLQDARQGEKSSVVAQRIAQARDIQKSRYTDDLTINANIKGDELEVVTQMDDETKALLTRSVEHAKMSARGYYRVLKVARTIADLNGGAETLQKSDVAEALSYRKIALNS